MYLEYMNIAHGWILLDRYGWRKLVIFWLRVFSISYIPRWVPCLYQALISPKRDWAEASNMPLIIDWKLHNVCCCRIFSDEEKDSPFLSKYGCLRGRKRLGYPSVCHVSLWRLISAVAADGTRDNSRNSCRSAT